MGELRSVEFCAGAGGQALGLEQAGFAHDAVIEIDPDAGNAFPPPVARTLGEAAADLRHG